MIGSECLDDSLVNGKGRKPTYWEKMDGIIFLVLPPLPCHKLVQLTLSQATLVFICLQYKSLKNIVPTVFSTHLEHFPPFLSNFILSSANPFNLEESKICCLGKSLKEILFFSLMLFCR